MIGPELTGGDLPDVFHLKTETAVIKFILVKADYKKYANSKKYLEPDLVAALNCGFIFYKSWDSSLDSMVRKNGAPLVFTEYYQQVQSMTLKIKHQSFKIAASYLQFE